MSGGGRHIVFKEMEIGAWPNGLTLDHLEKRIVWTDARYTLRVFMLCAEAFTPFKGCMTQNAAIYHRSLNKKNT